MIYFRFADTDINNLVSRTNAYQFIFYCQPEEEEKKIMFFNFLSSLKIPICVSPHHCKDVDYVDEDTGETEFKKGHFHFLIYFGEGKKKSVRQVLSLLDPILQYCAYAPWDRGDQPIEKVAFIWERDNKVQNMRGALRYFKHLDHPHKHQYFDESFITFGGFDVDNFIYNSTDCLIILRQIEDFIQENNIFYFCDLVDYARLNNSEWYSVIHRANYQATIDKYQRSLTYKHASGVEKFIDKISNDD